MALVNVACGRHVTVYHNFHDEVDHYRVHWWKCNGPCCKFPPFYGIVKRAQNRPPGPSDPWFTQHAKTCGGTFEKIREPEPRPADKKKRKVDVTTRAITDFFQKQPAQATPPPTTATKDKSEK
eukprot:TRINITY_DN686_c0_g1_i1.p2 TRINITY_DN686_c0_g1~~TRINITY_DN686_c0_g1_i1.p2  ORF type:complete len:123 (-),score=30.09 TRINITY_DN686_c0_g1_i1:42-410(-)